MPAGRHGFLKVRADQLVFEDGTVARFWGINLTANALFGTSKSAVKYQVHRLSELGFNLVRIHHQDSEWVVPNIFGDRNARNTRSLDPAMLARLDWWIKCLKDEGIYLWLDLHVGRQVKAADGVDGFAEISQGRSTASLNGYNYVNSSIQEIMRQFDDEYLNHQNRFTGLRYREDPAIAALLITNENDLTNHFGNALLPNQHVPQHTAIYLREAGSFAAKYALPKDRVWRSWEDGPAKLFLNDLERRFDIDMMAYLHNLGVKSPIATTSTWGMNPLSSLPALTAGDVVDAHAYGGAAELAKNPLVDATLVHWIAAARVAGKPLTVTEWGVDDHGSQAADRQDIPLYIAGSASMQGWNAVMFYAYSYEPLTDGGGTPSPYQAYNDATLMASLPAAALLYRQGHVKAANTTYVFEPSKEMLFDRPVSAANSVFLRTASERGKLEIAMPKVAELPWLDPSVIPPGATLIHDPGQSQISMNASEIVSDTGELTRNWKQQTYTINTSRTQAAMGEIGGRTISLGETEIDMVAHDAVVAVQSLDGNPIGRSQSIMISAGAPSVEGRILVRAPAGLGLRAWDPRAGKLRPMAVSYTAGRYVLALDGTLKSSWLLLSSKSPNAPPGSRNRAIKTT